MKQKQRHDVKAIILSAAFFAGAAAVPAQALSGNPCGTETCPELTWVQKFCLAITGGADFCYNL